MSALEKALRQIDQQQRAQGKPADHKELHEVIMYEDRKHQPWHLVLLACALVGLGALGWMVLKPLLVQPASVEAVQPPSSAASTAVPVPAATPPSPAASQEAPPPTPEASTVSASADAKGWIGPGEQLWEAGFHSQAARLWRDTLEKLPSDQPSLLIGEHLPFAQAVTVYKAWAGQMPVVALRASITNPARWMVLALPASSDLDAARKRLSVALGHEVAVQPLKRGLGQLNEQEALQKSAPASLRSEVPPAAKDIVHKAVASPRPEPSRPSPEAPVNTVTATTESTAVSASATTRAIENDFQAIEKLLARGEHASALEAAQKLERNVGETWRTRYLVGVSLLGANRWSEAAAALAQAQKQQPKHMLAALYHSVALQEMNDHARAIEVLDQALQSHPRAPELWLNLGHSQQNLGNQAEALKAYRRFMELSAQRSDLASQRAWVQARMPKEPG